MLLAVNVYRFVKPVPLVLMANSVPEPNKPPLYAVPYRVLPDTIKLPRGLAPSLLVGGEPEVAVKVYRFVKLVPLVLMANNVPEPNLPPDGAVPYRVLPDKTNPAFGLLPSRLV